MKNHSFFRYSVVLLLSIIVLGCSSPDDNSSSLIPVGQQPPLTWKTVSAGYYHSVAIRSDGSLWSWGSNEKGQLGNGTYLDGGIPQRIGSDNNWKATACGAYHVIALKNDGTLWAWGANDYKQLGNGSIINSVNHPMQIGTATDWKRIMACNNHSVGVKMNGGTYTWGNYNYNTAFDHYYPLPNISTPTQFTSANWVSMSTGDATNLFVQLDGTLWGSGRNAMFELGFSTDNLQTVLYETPIQIGIDNQWRTVASGNYHSIAVKSDGTIWTWGLFSLSWGTNTFSIIPKQIGLDSDWLYSACGINFIMAMRTDGTIWIWGSNQCGQLGDGVPPNNQRYAPAQLGNDNNWTAIFAGNHFAFAKKSDGTLWAWGGNEHGQLGNGQTVNSSVPIMIACPQ